MDAAKHRTARLVHRRRKWCAVRWVCTTGSAAILLAAIPCLFWDVVYVGTGTWNVGVTGGALAFGPGTINGIIEFETGTAAERWSRWADYAFVPTKAFGRIYTVPLWIPFLALVVPAAWLWHVDRRIVLPSACQYCGYDLTGNTSGRCPECGLAMEHRT